MTQGYALNFAKKIEFGKNDKVMTYYGTTASKDSRGEEFFCYIRCGLAGYRQMQDDFLHQTPALPETYGEVIYRDSIPEPDEKAIEFLNNWVAERRL